MTVQFVEQLMKVLSTGLPSRGGGCDPEGGDREGGALTAARLV